MRECTTNEEQRSCADHEQLLGLLKGLPCAAMVSGYPSALDDELLRFASD